jgi:hypothetical protein
MNKIKKKINKNKSIIKVKFKDLTLNFNHNLDSVQPLPKL